MHQVWREGAASHLGFYRIELAVVRAFVEETVERLRIDTTESDDPFAMWEASLAEGISTDEGDDERDPLLDRLFPPVFPDDPRASAEHRRFSEDDQRRQKAKEGDVVLSGLAAAKERRLPGSDEDPVHVVVVPDTELDAWLRTLNATRLALALELGITSAEDSDVLAELPEGDERVYPFSVYEFLGEVQAFLLGMLGLE